MKDELFVGLTEIAEALRCSVRKLHDPKLKNDMKAKGVIFRKRYKPYGQIVWAAYQSDLIEYQKKRAAAGDPL